MGNDKENLINKIANCIEIQDMEKTAAEQKKVLKLASTMLKVAAEDIKGLNQKVASLESEISSYKKEKELAVKKDKVDNLTDSMFNKGLIKKSDIKSKKDELMKIASDALDVMEDTINRIPVKTANEGLSDLTFLYQGNNIKGKENLNSALEEYVK